MKFAATILLLLMSVGLRAETAKIGVLTIDVPAGFSVQAEHQRDSLDDLEANRWSAADGRILEVLFYAGRPKKDRGPMIIAKEEEIEVLGQTTKLIETEVFFGENQKALVVHLRFGESIYIIDAVGIQRPDFIAVLKGLRHPKTEANQRPQGTPGREPSSSTKPEARRP